MKNRASRTAQHVAMFRALESVRRHSRLFSDPYAAAPLSPGFRLVVELARIPRVGARIEQYIDERWPAGPRASAVVRTKLIDDVVDTAVDEGIRQIILLGAGYDSRAFRLPSARSTEVFEVDHPATQQVKRRLIARRVPVSQREHVHFVAIDFLRQSLGAVLRRASLRHERTLIVWEGVTTYLNADSVDATLTDLVSVAAPGSWIVFTYMDRRALEGSGDFEGLTEWAASVRTVGEPFTFGFLPDELPDYLADRGLTLLSDCSAREAAVRYLEPVGRHEPAAPFYRIARAEVR